MGTFYCSLYIEPWEGVGGSHSVCYRPVVPADMVYYRPVALADTVCYRPVGPTDTVSLKSHVLEAHPSRGSLKSCGTSSPSQRDIFHKKLGVRASLPIAWHYARVGVSGESVIRISYLFQIGVFFHCLMCTSHSASFWTFL